MRKRQIAGLLLTLLIVIIVTWEMFTGSAPEMDLESVSKTGDETKHSSLPTESIEKSGYGFVTIILLLILILILILFLILHVIACVVWKIKTKTSWSMCFVTLKNAIFTRNRNCRGYTKLIYSDDEESRADSPTSHIPKTYSSVKFITEQYIPWLYQPIPLMLSKYSEKMRRSGEKRGLRNLGNTCYFNSVMQILTNTYILRTRIQQNEFSGEFSRRFNGFCKWTIDRRLGSNSSGTLRYLLCITAQQSDELREMHGMFSSRVKRFSDFGQHDSHECLRHVLDELRKDERDTRKKSLPSYDMRRSLTVVDQIFGGHFITVYVCKECGSPYHLFEPFLDISLPICLGSINDDDTGRSYAGAHTQQVDLQEYAIATDKIMLRLGLLDSPSEKHGLPRSKYSITDCLKYFTRVEHIRNEYLCNYCYSKHSDFVQADERLTSATKQTLIFSPPAVLTIHLKRFEMKPGRTEKRNDMITYEELLDIAPYCSRFCLHNDPPAQNLWYSLYGIVVHAGSLESGHYVAYIKVRRDEPDIGKFLQKEYFDRDTTKDELIEMIRVMENIQRRQAVRSEDVRPNEGIWYCMNDNWVSEVSNDEALRQEAYLLLYERI